MSNERYNGGPSDDEIRRLVNLPFNQDENGTEWVTLTPQMLARAVRRALAMPTDDVKSVLQDALNVLGCLEYGITGVDSWPCEDSVEAVVHRIRNVLEESQ